MTQDVDVGKTEEIDKLLSVPLSERNDIWKEQFYKLIDTASLSLPDENVFVGPDGFPYLLLNIPEPGQQYHSYSLRTVLGHCLENGLGLVIARGDMSKPEWVFPFGMLWCFKEFGKLEVPADEKIRGELLNETPAGRLSKEVVEESRQVMVGQPSEEYLPEYVRQVIRNFVTQRLNITDVQAFLLMDPAAEPTQSLVFSIFPDQFANENEYGAVLSMLRWYLPTHYGLAGIARDAEIGNAFTPF